MKKPWLEGIEVIDVNTPVSRWSGWFETFILTAILIAASFITQQEDPFRLNGGFPWLVLAPLLAGLRYGFVYGFVSALLTLAILGIAIDQQWQIASGFPLPWATGVVVVAMVAGEFRDMWGRRLHRLEGAYQYRAERLEEFTRSYQLLRLSHDRLEQTVANSGFSLREGIMRLQSTLHSIDGLTDASLQKLVEFVAEYGAVTQACIVGITADRIDTARVLACIGEWFPIDDSDPVLRTALERGELAAVNLIKEYVVDQNQLLAAIPLADSTGEIHAMLLVRSMPFFAFHESNLKLIAVLVAHGVDHLRFGTANPSTERFIASFERVYQDFSRFKLDATLVRLSGPPADVIDVYEKLRFSIRAIDLVCRAREKDQPVIWLLLPLTDTADAQAWMQKVEGVPATLTSELVAINEIDPQRIRSLEMH
jgi:polysaccharide biosynthesis protein PelD